MAKIQDVVSLKTGYANFVELKSAYEEAQENAERMAMYRPTKAHRRAFERITRGLYQPTDKKFYLLSGSYGTGKSHLCLMAANVLSRSSNDPEISGFYENYAKLDAEKATTLKNIRKDGQYLVAICEYHSGRRFEDVVLKAVFDACKARGLEVQIETEFDEAERQLSAWEELGESGGIRDFYQDFQKALALVAPAVPVQQLRERLKSYDSQALETFREAFRETMGGVEFQSHSGNLIPIIQKLVRSREFRDRFKGLAIFFDEFGATLEKSGYSKDVLQGFMETICKNEPNVIFVGCIHKDFKSYADRLSQSDANVMSARLTQVDLLNEGVEEIITAIVDTDKQSDLWRDEIAPKTGVFDQMLPVCQSLDLFPWISDVAHIRTRVLEDIYGVHPMALSCLLKLSSEVGSDARSTFTFFTDLHSEGTASYPEYISETDIVTQGGKLSLYTADRLSSFFRSELSPKNPDLRDGQRQIINGYHASLDALRKANPDELTGMEDDERLRVLKLVLMYRLCGIPTTAENVQFGMYSLSTHEKKHTEALLKDLVKFGAVFFRQQSKTYELAAGSGEDPYDLINRYLADESLHPGDIVTAFLEEASPKNREPFLKANGFNQPFSDDKRFRTEFIAAKDFGPSLWDSLHKDFEDSKLDPTKSYEGVLVYSLCETADDITLARQAVKTLAYGEIAVSIPHQETPFRETLLKVRACRYYLSPNQTVTAQTESRLRDILDNPNDGVLTLLKKQFAELYDGSASCWYRDNGDILFDKPQQNHKAADMLSETLFKERSRVNHPDLNQCHDDRWKTGRNNALKQAVDNLLRAERVFIDNGNPDNHGEKRYLEKVLLKAAGALKKTTSDGTQTYFVCETDPSKLTDTFPALRELCSRLSALQPGESLPLGTFLNEMREAPYGAGGTALILSLAHVIRGYGERLTFFKDSTKMVEYPLASYTDLASLVSDPASPVVCSLRNITPEQISLVNQIGGVVGAPALKHQEDRSLKETYDHVMSWYTGLPPVSRIITVHETGVQARLSKLKDVLDDTRGTSDHFGLLLERLPELYRDSSDSATLTTDDVQHIVQQFSEDVELFGGTQHIVETLVTAELCPVFGTTGDVIELEKSVTRWFKGLNPAQRSVHRYDEPDASALVQRLGEDIPFSSTVFSALPKDFCFGTVTEWSSLHIKDYAAKLGAAKQIVDDAQVEVASPAVDKPVYELQAGDAPVIAVPHGASTIVFTTDGSDPKSSMSAQKATDSVELAPLVNEEPSVKVKMRAVDSAGNYSEAVEIQVIDKQHKYEITIKEDMFAAEGTFTWPDDKDGFVAVLRSLLKHAKRKSIITNEVAQRVEAALLGEDAGGE